MKRLLYLVLLITISTSVLHAATIVYVDPNNASASDSNAGTDSSQPWATLNVGMWVDGMEIHLADATYLISSRIVLNKSVSLVGNNRDNVILQTMTDAEYILSTASFSMFQVVSNVSFSNMTIKNALVTSSDQFGGAFDVVSSVTLTLRNVSFTNLGTFASSWGGGGAIMVRGGSVVADNCSFINCQSNLGGAIMFFSNSGSVPYAAGILTNCQFINNSNPATLIGTDETRAGGAIATSGKVQVNLSECYFEGNSSRSANGTSGGQGGAIIVRLGSTQTDIVIENSVFYKNESDGAGSVLSTASYGLATSSVFNLSMRNNVLFQNKGNVRLTSDLTNTIGIYNHGVDYAGTILFVNNTLFQNYNAARANSKSVFLQSQPVYAYFVNNIMNDDEAGVSTYGLVCYDPSSPSTMRRFQGNIFNQLGGGFDVNNDNVKYPELYLSTSSNTENRSWISNTYQKVNTSLTVPTLGVPYLEILTGSMAANFSGSVSSYLVKGLNVVPDSDIRGANVSDGHKDAGAYEFSGITTGIEPVKDNNMSEIYYLHEKQSLIINHSSACNTSVFDINGRCLFRSVQEKTLDISALPKGVYIVKVESSDRVMNKKIFKF
ncbi:MAG: T9SS type A sorting domain-containing protein [Dysgonomonas sp.]